MGIWKVWEGKVVSRNFSSVSFNACLLSFYLCYTLWKKEGRRVRAGRKKEGWMCVCSGVCIAFVTLMGCVLRKGEVWIKQPLALPPFFFESLTHFLQSFQKSNSLHTFSLPYPHCHMPISRENLIKMKLRCK